MSRQLHKRGSAYFLANSVYTVANFQYLKDDEWKRTYSHLSGLVSDNSMLEFLAVAWDVAENLPE